MKTSKNITTSTFFDKKISFSIRGQDFFFGIQGLFSKLVLFGRKQKLNSNLLTLKLIFVIN